MRLHSVCSDTHIRCYVGSACQGTAEENELSRSSHICVKPFKVAVFFLFIIFHRRYLHLYLYAYYCTIV